MAIPPSINLEIYQGDTFTFAFRARSRTATGGPGPYYDLTGCTPLAQIRDADTDTVIDTFTATLGDQSVSAEKGKITLTLSHAQTADLDPNVPMIWDVQVTWPDTKVQTFLRGEVTLTKEITR